MRNGFPIRRGRLTAAVKVLIVLASTAIWGAYGQGGDANSLLQRLSSEFALTRMSPDKSDVVTAGTVVALLKPGFMMYSTASPMPPISTYKKGKISQGWGGFGRDTQITMASGGNGTANDYPHRQFEVQERLWVTAFVVRKDGLVFTLYSDPIDNVRYFGELKFPFEKGSIPGPDQAMATINEALSKIDSSQGDSLAGTYILAGAPGNYVEMNSDGTFSEVFLGQSFTGTYLVQGNQVLVHTGNVTIPCTRDGDTITDNTGHKWIKQAGASAAADNGSAPAAAPATNVLRNDDIVRMARAALDDSIIISKIKSSKCDFDTSTDTLIMLKQSGVSSAVLKAMTEAPH